MSDFADLLSRSVFASRLPRRTRSDSVAPEAAAPHAIAPEAAAPEAIATEAVGYAAVVFHKPQSDTADDGRGRVEPRRPVTVSCCLCPAAIRLSASGYGEMARRAEAAGWHYTPGRHLHERAWCPECRPNAGRAVF